QFLHPAHVVLKGLAMRHTPARRGTVIVLVAVCLTALLGVVALAVEGGLLMDNRRRAQAAADAAALAAAGELYQHYRVNQGRDDGSARAGALATAAADGFAD